MVSRMIILIMLFFAGAALHAVDVGVNAQVQSEGAYEQQLLHGYITILHDRNVAVDANSFRLEGKPLKADWYKDVSFSPKVVMSFYSFSLPGKVAGLYILPPVSVDVGGKTYQSMSSSYTVSKRSIELAPSPSPEQLHPTAVAPLLRLEAGVKGLSTLYPGQRTWLIYRYYFRGDIKLVKEELPMLAAKGFEKIGGKEIQNSQEDGISIMQIVQEVQAVKPGTYAFGPSVAEGYTYTTDIEGKIVYTSRKLTTQAKTINLTVLPFPTKGMPASFNGAVGKYTFNTELTAPAQVEVGNNVSLVMMISGQGNITAVPLPDLCCQPGFSGFFKESNLPPQEKITGTVKTGTVKLQVETDLAHAVPSVEFSYFDPDKEVYEILHSDPIPIHVKKETALLSQERLSLHGGGGAPSSKVERRQGLLAPLHGPSLPALSASDLHDLPFGTWWSVATVPLGAALIAFYYHLKNYTRWVRSIQVQPSSGTLLKRAFAVRGSCNFTLLNQALKQAMVENGLIASADVDDEALPDTGLIGEVKALFAAWDEWHFGQRPGYTVDAVRQQAAAMIERIRNEHSNKT